MRSGVCVGGIVEESCELIRCHGERGENLPFDAPYEIGDRWEMNVETAWNVRQPPHTEDKQTKAYRKIENIGINGITRFIKSNASRLRIARGHISNTFNGALHFMGNKNFINRSDIPPFSTQFWITDKPLSKVVSFGKTYYMYDNIRIKFVGYQQEVSVIPAGTIIRLSLANWWDGDGSGEDRCYLQLSGWYGGIMPRGIVAGDLNKGLKIVKEILAKL